MEVTPRLHRASHELRGVQLHAARGVPGSSLSVLYALLADPRSVVPGLVKLVYEVSSADNRRVVEATARGKVLVLLRQLRGLHPD